MRKAKKAKAKVKLTAKSRRLAKAGEDFISVANEPEPMKTVSLLLPPHLAKFLRDIAAAAGTDPDTAASVLFAATILGTITKEYQR